MISGAAFSFAFRSINKILSTKEDKRQKEGVIPASISQKCTVAAARSLQSYPTLCDPIDGSPPGYPVPGIHTCPQTHHAQWNCVPII